MASIDLSRFHQAFFEESFEGVERMESLLLGLNLAADNVDTVNSIFRAAHSIKGGAGTFGFPAVAAFTHHLETLLDQLRAGKVAVSAALTDLLLRSTDCVRDLLIAARDHGTADPAPIAAVESELRRACEGEASAATTKAAATAVPTACGYVIDFTPHVDLFHSGNDPLRIMSEVSGFGEPRTTVAMDRLPPLSELDALSSYLAWTIEIETAAPEAAIRDLFAWVEDDCQLSIAPMLKTAPASPQPAEPAAGVDLVAAEPVAVPVAPEPIVQPSAPVAAPVADASRPPRGGTVAEQATIRVGIDKIDALINLVSELVITQSMLAQNARMLDPVANEGLLAGLAQLEANTRLLQEAVMSTRMLPIDAVFQRFPRMLREISARLGKDVRLVTVGESTELDKGVIEKITDPLTHLVRNCVDHGVEPSAERLAAGKTAHGTLTLKAAHQGSQIVIDVIDDGRGLSRDRIIAKARRNGLAIADHAPDAEVHQLIFAPGFSTAEQVTDISGRGVGMDVVKRNIEALGGQVELASQSGEGTRVTIRLPLTLAILDGMLVSVGRETFVVPLNSVVESLRPTAEQVRTVGGSDRVVRVHDEYMPLVPLYALFGVATQIHDPRSGIVVVLEAEGRKMAMQVDDLIGQQQVVIKNLETNFHRVWGFSGATILGDGHVALIIDAGELVRSTFRAAVA